MAIRRTLLAATALSAASLAFHSAHAAEAKFYTDATLKSGDQYAVPKLWTSKGDGDHVMLSAPEKDAEVTLIAVDGASDMVDAVRKAWKLHKPSDEALKIDAPTAAVAENGWDERKSVSFPAPGGEKKTIQALGLRKGPHWLVMMTDAQKGAGERHSGTIGIIRGSLEPAGYKAENFAAKKPHHLDAERVQKLKTFITQSMQKLGIPGVGFALSENGKVLDEEGFGLRELGKPETVTKDTLFMIGSNTKGMTTLMIAKMVDEGKISWDKPATDYYPDLNPGQDAALTKKIMLRHLACACTGEPRQDSEWMMATYDNSPASKTFDLLKLSKPTTPFGEEFQYSNLMVSAIGFVAGHVAYPDMEIGAAYDRAIQEKVFDPLGMKSAVFDFKKALTLNHSSPHGIGLDGKPVVSARNFDYPAIRPAGTLWATAGDTLKYVQNEITPGKTADGKRLYSAKNVLERRTHSVATGKDTYYGIGLQSTKVNGIDIIYHGGGTTGHISQWYALPAAKVGMVVLTNSTQGSGLTGAVRQKLLELLYDAPAVAEAEVDTFVQNAATAHAKAVKDLQFPVPADVANSLAARYVSPLVGHVDVKKTNGGVTFDTGGYAMQMASKSSNGTVTLRGVDPGTAGVVYTVGKRDGKNTLTINDGQHEYEFQEAGAN